MIIIACCIRFYKKYLPKKVSATTSLRLRLLFIIEIKRENLKCYTLFSRCLTPISPKDVKAFIADLKDIYQASTEDAALSALDTLEKKWGTKYPSSVSSWRNNWSQLSTYFKYPPEIRKMIYTTNSIENFNRQLRKVTKSKTIFPSDDSLFKMLYLATMDITKKWGGRNRDWNQILAHLCIYFEDRISLRDID